MRGFVTAAAAGAACTTAAGRERTFITGTDRITADSGTGSTSTMDTGTLTLVTVRFEP